MQSESENWQNYVAVHRLVYLLLAINDTVMILWHGADMCIIKGERCSAVGMSVCLCAHISQKPHG